MIRMALITAALVLAGQAHAACRADVAPVVTLDFGSRYADGDASRSTLDKTSSKAVTQALKPVDTFIRQLARGSNAVLRDPAGETDRAACLVSAIDGWAKADALSSMESFNAGLALGSRLAGIAEAYRQLRPHSHDSAARNRIEDWLKRRARDQIDFWEIEATTGARDGNLRAWASLGVLLAGKAADDDFARFWAYGATARILCTARDDGSLPQETKRGSYALHYQFHAVAPLVTIAAHGKADGIAVPEMCNRALERVVGFTLTDFAAGGTATAGYSGQAQGFFDQDPARMAHHFAWLPAYLHAVDDPAARALLPRFETLANSKLGGDQMLIWGANDPAEPALAPTDAVLRPTITPRAPAFAPVKPAFP